MGLDRALPSRRQQALPAEAPTLSSNTRHKAVFERTNDLMEHEADRVADEVTRMSDLVLPIGAASSQIPASCALDELGQGNKENSRIKQTATARPQAARLGVVRNVVRLPGQALDIETQSFFEPRFGYDFSDVRIHADGAAGASARSVGALAYTIGSHVVFDAAQYSPRSDWGRRLLAHELAHVIQQGRGQHTVQRTPDPRTGPSADVIAVDQIVAALLEPQETGVGNFSAAFSALNGMWMAVMLRSLEQLNERGLLDLLHDNCPANMPRVQAALVAVSTKGTHQAWQILSTAAFETLPEQQQQEVAVYLGLSWHLQQDATTPPAREFQRFFELHRAPFTLQMFAVTDDMAGHAWIGVKDKDGDNLTIGFWPEASAGISVLFGAGVLHVHDKHEGDQNYVHTLDQPMSLEQAQRITSVIQSWDNSTYSLPFRNCTDFAVAVFRAVTGESSGGVDLTFGEHLLWTPAMLGKDIDTRKRVKAEVEAQKKR
jgi:hypothetical protein